jgi:hypothetical protein
MNALIGYTGFVGSTLLKQTEFDQLYRSKNIHEIEGKKFSLVVCAGAPAQKWIANTNPLEDERNIQTLIHHISKIETELFILISTVDVFKNPIEVNEDTLIDTVGLQPYGLNRRKLELFVTDRFKNYLILRLPGLVGPGLRKNIIYDFKNNNNVDKIDSRGVFQFYPMVNLWSDIKRALELNLKLAHLTSEPIMVSDVAKKCFGLNFRNEIMTPANYDFQSIYGKEFGGVSSKYQYSQKEILIAIRSYAQS